MKNLSDVLAGISPQCHFQKLVHIKGCFESKRILRILASEFHVKKGDISHRLSKPKQQKYRDQLHCISSGIFFFTHNMGDDMRTNNKTHSDL